jgi:hypothetical protein
VDRSQRALAATLQKVKAEKARRLCCAECGRIADEQAHGGRTYLTLDPYGYRWYRLGGLDYTLRQP